MVELHKCSEVNCPNKRTAKGLCQTHYDRMRSNLPKRRYGQLLKKCKDKDRETDLTEADVMAITKSNCFYCGQPNLSTGHGLDRVDSNVSYLKGNVVSCCPSCNYLKMDKSVDDFYRSIINIYKFLECKTSKLWMNAEEE